MYKSYKFITKVTLLPTHNALDWVGSSQHGLEDVHHSFVPQDGLLKHRQEVLMGEQNMLLLGCKLMHPKKKVVGTHCLAIHSL